MTKLIIIRRTFIKVGLIMVSTVTSIITGMLSINKMINKKNGSSFTANEVNLLNYLAHEFADYLVSTGQTGD